MNWVKNTLLQSTLSIDEIVSQIGYSHRNSLLIAFKKRFGCPPSEFRKKNAEKKADAQISPPQDKE